MENRDVELIQKHMINDKLLEMLYHKHLDFERQLEKFNSKPYLTPSEEMEKKNLQKLKLRGRDEMERILINYRRKESMT